MTSSRAQHYRGFQSKRRQRVRWSGGFSPGDGSISGLTAWYDFSDAATLFTDTTRTTLVTADADMIKGVTDKSGTGNHLSEATNGPQYKVNIQNGHSASRYDGVNDMLRNTFAATLTQPFTGFVVGKFLANETDSILTDGVVGTNRGQFAIYKPGATDDWGVYFGVGPIKAGTTDLNSHIFQAVANGVSGYLRVDGGTAVVSGNAGAMTMTGIALATDSLAGGSGFSNVDIYEILLYTGAMSTANIDRIGYYLAGKWGIVWTGAA